MSSTSSAFVVPAVGSLRPRSGRLLPVWRVSQTEGGPYPLASPRGIPGLRSLARAGRCTRQIGPLPAGKRLPACPLIRVFAGIDPLSGGRNAQRPRKLGCLPAHLLCICRVHLRAHSTIVGPTTRYRNYQAPSYSSVFHPHVLARLGAPFVGRTSIYRAFYLPAFSSWYPRSPPPSWSHLRPGSQASPASRSRTCPQSSAWRHELRCSR